MSKLFILVALSLVTGCTAFEKTPPEPWGVSDKRVVIGGCEKANKEAADKGEPPVC